MTDAVGRSKSRVDTNASTRNPKLHQELRRRDAFRAGHWPKLPVAQVPKRGKDFCHRTEQLALYSSLH